MRVETLGAFALWNFIKFVKPAEQKKRTRSLKKISGELHDMMLTSLTRSVLVRPDGHYIPLLR